MQAGLRGCGEGRACAVLRACISPGSRWRLWAEGGDVELRRLCRGLSEEQAAQFDEGHGMDAGVHDGSDEQHVQDIGR